MADAICIACTVGDDVVDFPNMLELKKHEMLGHTTRWEKPLPVDPRGDHPSATELKAMKEQKPEAAKPQATENSVPSEPEVKPIPLSLKYKWEGQCPTCRDTVKTIDIEEEGHSIIVAYCVRCDKKVDQEKVVPIHLQPVFSIRKKKEDDMFEKNMKRPGKLLA